MAAGLAAASVAPVSAVAHGAVRVELPAPGGPYEIGTVALHLVDRSRADPWEGSPQRELMISVWYPATGSGQRVAPHMERGAAERFGAVTRHRIPPGTVDWAATRTHAGEGAPVDPRGPWPVVVYSPGSGDPRSWGTVLVEELASRGYVVATIDHTYESPAVQFPDGSVKGNDRMLEEFARAQEEGTVPAVLAKMLHARIGDTRFVLDQLATLPRGMADLRRVGMFGQSAGGFTAAQGMYEDRRIRAGIDLDGTLEFNSEPNGTNLSSVALHGLRRPFMLMGRQGIDHTNEPSWGAFWSHSRGWRRDLTLLGSKHQTYTDLAAIMPQTGLPRNVMEGAIGTTDPSRAVVAQRAFAVSFFDRWLRHRDDHLLDGPSPRYPEIKFVR
ncbi:alpha/beta hydrolase family protein [Actinomadura sp. 6N118]|uniref:alpha/beta hydrolase family protein n=1 Tax=Actinomadura sp. 6N118 TaxID=3375151 RepID=UPI00379076C3